MKVRVQFPIKLTVGADVLQGDALDRTGALLLSIVESHWLTAQRELQADGIAGESRVASIAFDWTGPSRRQLSEPERRAIERRLKAVVQRATSQQLPPPAPKEEWTVQRLELQARFGALLEVVHDAALANTDELRLRYRDQLSDRVYGIAWVVTVHVPARWSRLHAELEARWRRELGGSALFAYFWDATRTEQLRALDKRRLAALPKLRGEEAVAPASAASAGSWSVPAGARIVFVGAQLPELKVEDLLEIGPAVAIELTFFDALGGGVFDDAVWQRLGAAGEGAVLALLELYGDVAFPVRVWPFYVKRATSERAVRLHVFERVSADDRRAKALGQLHVLTTRDSASMLPRELLEPARRLGGGKTAEPDVLHPDRDWPPGVRGVFYLPALDARTMQARVFYANRWNTEIKLEAAELVRILDLENGFWSAPRRDAFWRWAVAAQSDDPERFDLLLLALEKRGALGRFFDAWLEENLYPVTLRPLIEKSLRSRFAQHPRLRHVIRKIESWQRGLLQHGYDVDEQRIRLFGSDDRDRWILAARDSADPAAGVVAETSSYYSESHGIKRLTKQALERLSEPIQRKVGDLMARLVCRGEEKTEQEILALAIQEAAKEARLDPDRDFESAKIRLSLRVLALERRSVGGVVETFVRYEPVRQLAGGAWERNGKVEERSALAFEAELKYYHVQHLATALAIVGLAGAIVLTGAALLAAGIATVTEIVVVIVISEAIYLWTNRHEGYTLTGFLMAAWLGELELVGFKGVGRVLGIVGGVGRTLGAGAITKLLGEAGAKAVTSKVLRASATKWIALALRAGVTGFELGVVSVLDLLAHDLFEMTHCKGLSSPAAYWDRFTTGMLVGAALELIAIPLLAPLARALANKASTMLEAAKLLRAEGKSFGEIAKVLRQGSEAMERALGRTLEQPQITEPLARGFGAKMQELLRVYAREYETRAYQSVIRLIDRELSGPASAGLARVLEAAPAKEIDQLLANLARGKVPPHEALELLAVLDEPAMRALVRSGNLARLGDAPALLGFLRRHPKSGWRLLGDVFGNAVDDLEAFLARFAKSDPMLVDNAASILLRNGNALPRDLVADLVLRNGGVTTAQMSLLDHLAASNVKISAFVEGRGPTLPEFEKSFSQYSPAEQALGLAQVAPATTPQQLLRALATTKKELEQISRRLFQPPQEVEAEMERVLRGLKPGEKPPPSRPTYKEVKKELRTTEEKDPRTRATLAVHRGKYEGFVDLRVLRANVEAYRRLQQMIKRYDPDVILGTERGGEFIVDVLQHGNPALKPKILRPRKLPEDQMYPALRDQLDALILAGKQRFVFVDAYMGGFNAGYLVDRVFVPLLEKRGQQLVNLRFGSLWIREKWGLEFGASLARYANKGPWRSRIFGEEAEVPWIFGDDVNLIMGGAERGPIHIYLPDGTVVRTLTPAGQEKTRDLAIRVLNGEGLEGLPDAP